MNSNLTFNISVGTGTQTAYPITASGENMGYFRTSDITGYVDGVEVQTTINPSTPHMIIFTTAPALGSKVMVRREMPIGKPYADFERGNNFGHRQINNSFLQQLYLTQELLDGFLDDGFYFKQNINLGGYKITNMKDGTSLQDATTYSQLSKVEGKNDLWNKKQDERLDTIENSTETSSVNYLVDFRFLSIDGGEVDIATHYDFNYCNLSINGLVQVKGIAYTTLEGVIHLAEPLEPDDIVYAQLGTFESVVIGDSFLDYIVDIKEVSNRIKVPDFVTSSLYLNGLLQIPNRSYTQFKDIIVFAEALEIDDVIHILYKAKE